MQKLATRIFIIASIVFGIVGILMVLTAPIGNSDAAPPTALNQTLQKLLFISIFVILPSFALSVAARYLNGKS